MIISTNRSDTMMKRALGKGQTSIIDINRMIDQFALDPSLNTPVRDAYIVTNEDISSKQLTSKFEQALTTKHPDVKIIFINKSTKPIYPNGKPGIDAVLQKPKPQDIAQAISAVVQSNTISQAAVPEAKLGLEIPEYDPSQIVRQRKGNPMQETFNMKDEVPEEEVHNQTIRTEIEMTGGIEGQEVPYYGMDQFGNPINGNDGTMVGDGINSNGMPGAYDSNGIPLPGVGVVEQYGDGSYLGTDGVVYNADGTVKGVEPFFSGITEENGIPAPPPIEETEKESDLIRRIKEQSTVADVSVLLKNITSAQLIKDVIESNSTYAGIEEKLESINNTIYLILADSSIPSLDEKLSKIRAMLHDKAFYHAKGDTIIEQRLEEVIDTICTHTSSLLQDRLNEIDTAMRRVMTTKDSDINSARLTGLNEERANIILELRTLEIEINSIFKSADMLVMTTATQIAQNSDNLTGNDMINTHLKARGTAVLSEETVTAIRAALEITAERLPDAFKEMRLKVIVLIKTLGKLFDIDQEIIAAQQAEINFLKAHNVEDSVIAETILKKALRVYIGEEDSGRSIIPYLIAKYKSRQNANVLCIDLTGEAKYSKYGIKYTSLDTYLVDLNQREFLLVAGTVDNTVEAAQRMVTTLIKAADYYRVINVVLTPEQRELFSTIAQDVYSVNFIVDTNVSRIERMRFVIEECTMPNVGRRVIINKCDIPIRPIIKKLGLDDQIDFQACVVPTVHTITDAGLNGYDPYGVSSVDLVMEEVVKHA